MKFVRWLDRALEGNHALVLLPFKALLLLTDRGHAIIESLLILPYRRLFRDLVVIVFD